MLHAFLFSDISIFPNLYAMRHMPSLVPRPSASIAHLTFELARNQKSGGESGEFYHVSDVKGREKVERT